MQVKKFILKYGKGWHHIQDKMKQSDLALRGRLQGTESRMQVPEAGSASSTMTNGLSCSVTTRRCWASSGGLRKGPQRDQAGYRSLSTPFSHQPTQGNRREKRQRKVKYKDRFLDFTLLIIINQHVIFAVTSENHQKQSHHTDSVDFLCRARRQRCPKISNLDLKLLKQRFSKRMTELDHVTISGFSTVSKFREYFLLILFPYKILYDSVFASISENYICAVGLINLKRLLLPRAYTYYTHYYNNGFIPSKHKFLYMIGPLILPICCTDDLTAKSRKKVLFVTRLDQKHLCLLVFCFSYFCTEMLCNISNCYYSLI